MTAGDRLDGPRYSVIVPTHRRAHRLQAALCSVAAQTVDDLECVVVVDGGDEHGVDDSILPDDERFRIVRRAENGGPGAARNTGVAASRGRFVSFLDDDDVWFPQRLELAEAGLARAPLAICWGENSVGRDWTGEVYDSILDPPLPQLNGIALERSAFVPFDENLRGGEDIDWYLRMAPRVRFQTIPELGYSVTKHREERPDAARRLADQKRLLERHAEYFASHPRAGAYRWERYGRLQLAAGNKREARMALLRALRIRPRVGLIRPLARSVIGSA